MNVILKFRNDTHLTTFLNFLLDVLRRIHFTSLLIPEIVSFGFLAKNINLSLYYPRHYSPSMIPPPPFPIFLSENRFGAVSTPCLSLPPTHPYLNVL